MKQLPENLKHLKLDLSENKFYLCIENMNWVGEGLR